MRMFLKLLTIDLVEAEELKMIYKVVRFDLITIVLYDVYTHVKYRQRCQKDPSLRDGNIKKTLLGNFTQKNVNLLECY